MAGRVAMFKLARRSRCGHGLGEVLCYFLRVKSSEQITAKQCKSSLEHVHIEIAWAWKGVRRHNIAARQG